MAYSADLEEGLRCARSWGDWEFRQEAWSEAALAYEYAGRITERLLKIQLFRQGKELWLNETQGVPSRLAYALAKADDLYGAVLALERGRARLLTESLDRDRADLERLREFGRVDLYERYAVAAEKWIMLSEKAPVPSAAREDATFNISELVENLRTVQSELDAVAEEIRSVRGYEQFQIPISFEEVQSIAVKAPLTYLATTPAGSMALTVTANDKNVEWLDITEQELEDLLIKTGPEGGPGGEPHMFPLVGGYVHAQTVEPNRLEEALDEILPVLGEKVMSNVAEYLREIDAREVVIIPNGQLGSVPLHAASYELDGNAACFLDEIDTSYAPNARSLSVARKSLARTTRDPYLVGVGNPLPTNEDSLRWARFELEGVTVFFGDAARPLYEHEATKTNLEATIQEATHLHFACHGYFSIAYPPDSGLLLAHDEKLTLEELLYGRLKIPESRIAILSACQSAIVSSGGLPDEYIGLPVGLLQAGIPGVVGTLWPVDDHKTALLMVKFYELHLRGDSKSGEGPMAPVRALCEAQRWLRRVDTSGLLNFLDEYPAIARTLRNALRGNPEDVLSEVIQNPTSMPDAPLFADQPVLWAPFVFVGA